MLHVSKYTAWPKKGSHTHYFIGPPLALITGRICFHNITRFMSVQCCYEFSPRSRTTTGRVGPLCEAFSSTSQRSSLGLRSGPCDVSCSLNHTFTIWADESWYCISFRPHFFLRRWFPTVLPVGNNELVSSKSNFSFSLMFFLPGMFSLLDAGNDLSNIFSTSTWWVFEYGCSRKEKLLIASAFKELLTSWKVISPAVIIQQEPLTYLLS